MLLEFLHRRHHWHMPHGLVISDLAAGTRGMLIVIRVIVIGKVSICVGYSEFLCLSQLMMVFQRP